MSGRAEVVSAELLERLVALRHDLHRYPELAFEERRTADRLERELATLSLSVRRVGETGLVARVPGRDRSLPPVAVRGDIDALPITEETGAPFASEVPGRMHACGHDVHASWAVGAAALLADEPAAGDVLVVLQPAEEVGRGAETVIASGALDGVRAIFGGHVDLAFEVGQVVAQEGPLAASADTFRIVVEGAGAHGARPHEGADPVVAASAVVLALQTVVSRRLDPGRPAVLTVGRIHGGSAHNVIPDRVELEGTLRATDGATRERLHAELRRVAEATAEAHGTRARVTIDTGPPPLDNDPRAAGWAREAVAEVLGEAALRPLGRVNMAGEDFAVYLERIPGCFLRIGARRPGTEPVAAHSPRFLPDDGAVAVGSAVLAAAARRSSAALGAGP